MKSGVFPSTGPAKFVDFGITTAVLGNLGSGVKGPRKKTTEMR